MQKFRAVLSVLLLGVMAAACNSEPTGPGPVRYDNSGVTGSGHRAEESIPSYSSGVTGSGH